MPSSWITILIAPKAEADLGLLFPKKKVYGSLIMTCIYEANADLQVLLPEQVRAEYNYYLRTRDVLLNVR